MTESSILSHVHIYQDQESRGWRTLTCLFIYKTDILVEVIRRTFGFTKAASCLNCYQSRLLRHIRPLARQSLASHYDVPGGKHDRNTKTYLHKFIKAKMFWTSKLFPVTEKEKQHGSSLQYGSFMNPFITEQTLSGTNVLLHMQVFPDLVIKVEITKSSIWQEHISFLWPKTTVSMFMEVNLLWSNLTMKSCG